METQNAKTKVTKEAKPLSYSDLQGLLRKKFETYKKITEESGEQQAWNTLFQEYPERQRKIMGPFIENNTLAEGFTRAIPIYKQYGMEMEVVDISNNNIDAVLEVQKVCPSMKLAKDCGIDKPCRIVCEMDVEATKVAFGMKGDILARQADGDCVCIFKYERPKT